MDPESQTSTTHSRCEGPDRTSGRVPTPPRLLVTAGPTHEPIDEVRFLGNRSSGRLGIEIAAEAARRTWPTTLLLGPVDAAVDLPEHVRVRRFTTSRDLESALSRHAGDTDLLIMAAAVADHRPVGVHPGKLRRDGDRIALELEAVPDLVAGVAAARPRGDTPPRPTIVAFALEPADELEVSARRKLRRKGVEAIIANPIETLASDVIEATLLRADGEIRRPTTTAGPPTKKAFAAWLLDECLELLRK